MTNLNNESIKGIIIEKVREIRTDLFQVLVDKYEVITAKTENIGYTNLKVYTIASYLSEIQSTGLFGTNEWDVIFQNIIDFEYESFVEWEKENLSHVERNYIGRTSSFYYNTNSELYYSGGIIQDLLEGKEIPLEDVTGDLSSELHDLLFENDTDETINNLIADFKLELEDNLELEINDYLQDLWESDIEILEELDNELDEMLEIVNEALFAYDYLNSYKTEENEMYIVNDYIEYNYIEDKSIDKAEKIYNKLLTELIPINKLTLLVLTVQLKDNEYIILAETNLKSVEVHTGITNEYELSGKLMEYILEDLNQLFENNFKF